MAAAERLPSLLTGPLLKDAGGYSPMGEGANNPFPAGWQGAGRRTQAKRHCRAPSANADIRYRGPGNLRDWSRA